MDYSDCPENWTGKVMEEGELRVYLGADVEQCSLNGSLMVAAVSHSVVQRLPCRFREHGRE